MTILETSKIITVTIEEFDKAWKESSGRVTIGSQYSNCDSANYLVAVNALDFKAMAFEIETYGIVRALSWFKEKTTNIKKHFDVGYALYNTEKTPTIETISEEVITLPENWTTVYHVYQQYPNNSSKIIAQRSLCKEYVTIFPS